MALGFFSAKNEHPLADAGEAKRVCAEIASVDAAVGVDHATACFESLAVATEMRCDLRLDRLLRLDEAAAPQARRLARDYVSLTSASRAQELKLWQANHEYWVGLTHGYQSCLAAYRAGEKGSDAIKANFGLLCARMLCACAGRLKWNQMRYLALDGELWAAIGGAYLAAVDAKLAERSLALYTGSETTVQAEYLKILVFQATSTDKLVPLEIEIAERLVSHFLPHFIFTANPRPDNVYWVDAAKPLPPTRLARAPAVTPTLRFLSSGKAAAAVAELRLDIAAKQALPRDLVLGGQYAVTTVLAVLDHLARCWAPTPPMRTHARHRVASRLAVIGDIAALHERLLNPFWGADEPEKWTTADVGRGGMGAMAPTTAKDWIRIGALIGLQPEGGDNWLLGVVRRYARESDKQAAVGIETLSTSMRAIVADCGGLKTAGLLLDPPDAGTLVRVVVADGLWEARIALLLELDGQCLRLQPAGVVESVAGHVIGRYALSIG